MDIYSLWIAALIPKAAWPRCNRYLPIGVGWLNNTWSYGIAPKGPPLGAFPYFYKIIYTTC